MNRVVFKKWEHNLLNVVNVIATPIFSFILGSILTAKLLNMNIPFSTADYGLMGISIYIIFMFQKERWQDLNKEFISKDKGDGK